MKILTANGQKFYLESIKTKLVELGAGIDFVTLNDENKLSCLRNDHPDVDLALIEQLSDSKGYEQILMLRSHWPSLPIIVISDVQDCARVKALFDLGAKGFILHTYPAEMIFPIINLVCAGGIYLPPILMHEVQSIDAYKNELPSPMNFSNRQKQILELVVKGYSNKKIASSMNLSYGTVKNYISVLMQQLLVNSRFELAVKIQKSDYRLIEVERRHSKNSYVRFDAVQEIKSDQENERMNVSAARYPNRYLESGKASSLSLFGDLSKRQRAVLSELIMGSPNKIIATTLGIAEGTVKNLVSSLLEKFKVDSRPQLMLAVNRMGYQFNTVHTSASGKFVDSFSG